MPRFLSAKASTQAMVPREDSESQVINAAMRFQERKRFARKSLNHHLF